MLVFGFIGKIPYQEKTPMRINIVDVDRTWYNSNGETINRTEAGYWFWPYDSNMKDYFSTLEKSVPELSTIEKIDVDYDNCKDLYCAQPFTWPMVKSIKKTYWLPHTSDQSRLPDSMKTSVRMTYTVSGSANDRQRRVDFSLEGPTQFALVLSPGPSFKLTNWTLSKNIPTKVQSWKGRSSYFIYHGRGFEMQTIRFTCYFNHTELAPSQGSTIATVQYSAFYMYGDELMTDEFRDMVDRLPGWTYTMPWTSVMKMYEIVG